MNTANFTLSDVTSDKQRQAIELANMLESATGEVRMRILATLQDLTGVQVEASTGGLSWDNFSQLFAGGQGDNAVQGQRVIDQDIPPDGVVTARYCHWCHHGGDRDGALTQCGMYQHPVSNVEAARCNLYSAKAVGEGWAELIAVDKQARRCKMCANSVFSDGTFTKCSVLDGKTLNDTYAVRCGKWRDGRLP